MFIVHCNFYIDWLSKSNLAHNKKNKFIEKSFEEYSVVRYLAKLQHGDETYK